MAGSAGVSSVEMRLINVDRVSFVKIAFRPSATREYESQKNRIEEEKRKEQRTEQGYRYLAGYDRVASNGNCNGNGSAVRHFVM